MDLKLDNNNTKRQLVIYYERRIEVTEKSLEIVLMVSSEDKTTFCEIWDFKSVSKKVLDLHIKRKHGKY